MLDAGQRIEGNHLTLVEIANSLYRYCLSRMLKKERSIRIIRRLMRFVAAFLAFGVDCGVAPAVARRWLAAILLSEALDRCSRLDNGRRW